MERADNLGDISFTETSSAYMDPFIMYTKDAMPQLLRGAVRQSATDVDLFSTRQVSWASSESVWSESGLIKESHNFRLCTDIIQEYAIYLL